MIGKLKTSRKRARVCRLRSHIREIYIVLKIQGGNPNSRFAFTPTVPISKGVCIMYKETSMPVLISEGELARVMVKPYQFENW